MSRPSRLHRTIPGHSDLFTIASEPLDFFDDDLVQVVVHRGPGARGGGYAASTLEFTTPQRLAPTITGYDASFYLRPAVAADLEAMTGIPAASLEDRWRGRLATVDVDDRGDRRVSSSTVRGASWATQMIDSARTTTPTAGRTVKRAVEDALGITDGTPPRGIFLDTFGTFDRLAETADQPMKWTDLVSTYLEAYGYVLRESRAGRLQLFSLPYLRDFAVSQNNTQVSVSRSAALSPAQWTMRNERPPADHAWTVTDPATGLPVRTVAHLDNTTGELASTVELDWSHMYADTDQARLEAYGRTYAASTRQYRLAPITVDLLTLLSSANPYHRRQAGQLLALNPWDPVTLSGDWPWQVTGVHFAVGLSERITARTWELELTLLPHAQAVGEPGPAPRAWTWHQHPATWDAATGTWNSHTPTPAL